MADIRQIRIDISKRSAEEFISEMRDAASHMVANALTEAERDMALGLCDWADEAERGRRLSERRAWLVEQGRTPALMARFDEDMTMALDEQIAKAKADGWKWADEQAWMDSHMPKVDAQAAADWLHGGAD